jgi:hypothetical protein
MAIGVNIYTLFSAAILQAAVYDDGMIVRTGNG